MRTAYRISAAESRTSLANLNLAGSCSALPQGFASGYHLSVVADRHLKKPDAYLILVLHAHLPYIRYPDTERHLEETWLYEAITETYIPLLDLLGRLIDENADFRITLSLTPSLLEMLSDPLLRERYLRHLDLMTELAQKETTRTEGDRRFQPLAGLYFRMFRRAKGRFVKTYRSDLAGAFRRLGETRKVELITSAATHAYLPALMTEQAAVRPQIACAVDHFKKQFGTQPRGIWLPECGYDPRVEQLLKENGIRFFFLESHGILAGRPNPRASIYRPVRTPAGLAAFARDVDSSRQVWSSVEGYPGDPAYRDFYRDIGFDLDEAYVMPYLPGGIRTFTGLKYFRVTGGTDRKEPYIPKVARARARVHARHFLSSKKEQAAFLRAMLKKTPVITAAYDAELFGHWWFEGPLWLGHLLRNASKAGIRLVTPSEYLRQEGRLQVVAPSQSSWGRAGYHATWIDRSNAWMLRHLAKAAERMNDAAGKLRAASGAVERALNQAARELLLAQASDWPFMIRNKTAAEFARGSFTSHLKNMHLLLRMAETGRVDLAKLENIEAKNRIFTELDFRVFADKF